MKHLNISSFAFQKPLILHIQLLLSHRRSLFWNYWIQSESFCTVFILCAWHFQIIILKTLCWLRRFLPRSPSFLPVITKKFSQRLRHFSSIGSPRAQSEFLKILQRRACLLSCPGQLDGVLVRVRTTVSFNFPNFRHSVILDFLADGQFKFKHYRPG